MASYFIIDGLNLAYRAHNANIELKTSKDMPSGMFFGFVRTLFSLKKKYLGYKFSVVWDSKPKHKYELQPDYKAGRTSLSSDVFYQVDALKKFLRHCGVDQYLVEGQEADDVIASLVESLKGDAQTIIVYTNDKDMLQLVQDGKVIVYKPKTSSSEEKFYDEEAVRQLFGVPVSKLHLFRSFDGDPSDNLNGVPRVPRKIIARLVCAHDDLTSIYEALDTEKLTDFQRASFKESRMAVHINEKIMKLDRSLPVLADRAVVDKGVLEEVLGSYEVKSINTDHLVEAFTAVVNMKYSTPSESIQIETYSLF